MSDPLSNFWGRLKKRSRRFAAADETNEQTHMNHALVMVLLFGTIGAGLALMFDHALSVGLKAGVVVGWGFYILREFNQRLSISQWVVANDEAPRWLRWFRFPIGLRLDWRWNAWDGICDVLVPLWITAPIVSGSVVLLWVLSALVAVMYFVFRPLDDGGAA